MTKALLLLLAVGAVTATATTTAFALPTIEPEGATSTTTFASATTTTINEDGLLCDSRAAERLHVLTQALGILRGDYKYEIHEGNLSFHLGGNPAGKYGVVRFDTSLLPAAMQKANKATAAFPLPLEASFLMGPRDAVFWYGCTPPPVRYFSIRSYLAYRFPGEGRNISGFMPGAELGDPTNNAVIQTTGGPHDPFSKTTLFVSTGDQLAFHRVREAFREAGHPESATNLDTLPSELVHFRNERLPWAFSRSDTIAWQFRVNEFVNPAESAAYLDKSWPVFLLRANLNEGKDGGMPPMPLTTPPLKARGTGESEEWLRPALDELVAAVETRMAAERGLVLAHTFPLTPLIPDAARCISDLSYCPVSMPIPAYNLTACNPTCDWFTRDSLYSTPPSDSDFLNFLLPKDRVLVVVGVNHALLGKASFTNFLMTGIKNPERPGHTPNFSSNHLAGSGQYFLPSRRPESDFLYAQELSRDCGTPAMRFCELVTEECIAYDEYLFFAERVRVWVGTEGFRKELAALLVAFDRIHMLWQPNMQSVSLRFHCSHRHNLHSLLLFLSSSLPFPLQAYLEPTTTVGPSPDEIISPFILAFDPAPAPVAASVRSRSAATSGGKKKAAAAKLRGQGSSLMDEKEEWKSVAAEQ